MLVHHFHDEAVGGHSGANVTMKKLGSLFYWNVQKNMMVDPLTALLYEVQVLDFLKTLITRVLHEHELLVIKTYPDHHKNNMIKTMAIKGRY
nr:Rho GTPase-activating protein 5-like [Tanacetum cinerariifolium]